MSEKIYPLKFEPIYQYRVWGGRRLENMLSKRLPEREPVGEAWLLSDRKEHASKVSEGSLRGHTITDLMIKYHTEIMGGADRSDRFPLLLKFLDCKELLSVQVHPSDDKKKYIPKGDTGKTEAWVVLETGDESRIYAGLKAGTDMDNLQEAMHNKRLPDVLHSFVPNVGDAVFIQSGTVHTLGDTVVFEVQENSDVTYRLYDWDRIDPKTSKPRELQVDNALACIDFDQVDIDPVHPYRSREVENAEMLFDNKHFRLWRIKSETKTVVGLNNQPVILVCIDGDGKMHYDEKDYTLSKGDVMLIPAAVGTLDLVSTKKITLFQIAIPL